MNNKKILVLTIIFAMFTTTISAGTSNATTAPSAGSLSKADIQLIDKATKGNFKGLTSTAIKQLKQFLSAYAESSINAEGKDTKSTKSAARSTSRRPGKIKSKRPYLIK